VARVDVLAEEVEEVVGVLDVGVVHADPAPADLHVEPGGIVELDVFEESVAVQFRPEVLDQPAPR
jgi:hypothetical protein